MNEYIISTITNSDLPRMVVTFFGLFLFVWLFKLGMNLIIRWFDKI